MINQRATVEEKAQAWDRLMKNTNGNDAIALQDAWQWLCDTVERRELRDALFTGDVDTVRQLTEPEDRRNQ